MADQKSFLSASEVAEISKSYNIIRQLNEEMTEKGYLVMSGKINRKYFFERIYDGQANA